MGFTHIGNQKKTTVRYWNKIEDGKSYADYLVEDIKRRGGNLKLYGSLIGWGRVKKELENEKT